MTTYLTDMYSGSHSVLFKYGVVVNYYVMYEWGRNKRRTASEKEVDKL